MSNPIHTRDGKTTSLVDEANHYPPLVIEEQ